MSKRLLAVVFFLMILAKAHGATAAVPEPPSIIVLQGITQSLMYFNDWRKVPSMNAEVTPWSLGTQRLGGWHSFLVTTANSYLCSTPSNMFALTQEEDITCRGCVLLETEDIVRSRAAVLGSWKRDYYGAISAHVIRKYPDQNIYIINHSELKDDKPAYGFTDMSGASCLPAPDMGYGSDFSWSKNAGARPICDPAYEWPSYNAFISMSSMPYTQAAISGGKPFVTEYGPIVWPSNGYVELAPDGTHWIKASDGGVRHPSSIITGGYIYVFYDDLSQGQESDGRGPGIKVARAPVTSSGIDPVSFNTYFNGGFNEPALPPGFSLNHYWMWSSKGGKASSLFPSDVISVAPTPYTGQKTRRIDDKIFSVARVNGTDWFIGVANELRLGTTLRLSKDLVTWSAPVVIPGTESNYFSGKVNLQTDLPFLHARFANADGDSNTDINPNNFYVIGMGVASHNGTQAKVVNTIHLSVTLPTQILRPNRIKE